MAFRLHPDLRTVPLAGIALPVVGPAAIHFLLPGARTPFYSALYCR